MRKFLIAVLLVLLIVLAYFTIFEGISIGSFEILSAKGIADLNNDLTDKIDEANMKIKADLQKKKNELSENVDTLLKNKESYYNLANVSTENEIDEASTEETYNIEYLWLRIGRHARTEGVNIRMDILAGNAGDPSIKNISFTVTGQYVSIIDFVSSLEDDSELAFRIDSFHLLPAGENLEATFSVNNIRIKLEEVTQEVGQSQADGEQEGQEDQVNQVSTPNTNSIVE